MFLFFFIYHLRAEWGGYIVFNSYTSNSKGVCILFNNNLEYKIVYIKKDGEGNFILLDMIIEDKKTYFSYHLWAQ